MDFSFSHEQTQIGDSLRRYLAKSYTLPDRMRATEASRGFDDEHWNAFADMGILALNVPEAHGGLASDDGNPIDTLVVLREIGRGLCVEPVWMSGVVCANLIALSGNDALQAELLPSLADGTAVFTLAALEHGGRYDFTHVTTRATRTVDGFTLSGKKAVVLHGGQADKLLVTARLSAAESGAASSAADAAPTATDNIAIFVVDRDRPGVHLLDYQTVDELRGADITFNGVNVAPEAMLVDGANGSSILARAIERANAALCAEALGIVEALTDATNEYLKTRKQFGVPIGKFQALQHRVADMLVSVEQVRAMAYYAAAKVTIDEPAERSRAIAAARVAVAEASKFVSKNAVQLHGGMGVTDELVVSHYVKRLTMLNQTYGDYGHHLAAYAALMEA